MEGEDIYLTHEVLEMERHCWCCSKVRYAWAPDWWYTGNSVASWCGRHIAAVPREKRHFLRLDSVLHTRVVDSREEKNNFMIRCFASDSNGISSSLPWKCMIYISSVQKGVMQNIVNKRMSKNTRVKRCLKIHE